jgi:hypothetical protein
VPSTESKHRADPFDRPLDCLLERLRFHELAYRPKHDDIERWITSCPICGEELLLHEPFVGSAVTVRCAGSCHETRIVGRLAAEFCRPDLALELAEQVSRVAHRALELLEARCQ